MVLRLTISASVVGSLSGDNDLASVNAAINKVKALNLKTGSGLNQANLMFADRRTLAASASEELDLSGVLLDVFGVPLSFAKVKAIYIVADEANTNDVVLGGAAANAFFGPFGAATHKLNVPPGGVALLAAPGANGWPVTPGTADILKVANSAAGTPVSYEIVIVGA